MKFDYVLLNQPMREYKNQPHDINTNTPARQHHENEASATK